MNCSKNKTSELHSVVFKTEPPNRWTTETSRQWLKEHDIKRLKTVDKTKNSLRYRIVDPKCFKSFSTQVVKSEMGTINLVIGWYVDQPKKKPKGGRFRAPKKMKLNEKKMNLAKKGKIQFRSRKKGGGFSSGNPSKY